jgi:hypothetical protein
MNLPSTERLYDLSDVNEVSDTEVRTIISLLLNNLNLTPVRKTWMRKDIETVSYHLEPTKE